MCAMVFDFVIFLECVYVLVYMCMDRVCYFKFTFSFYLVACVFSKERERINRVGWVVSGQDLISRNLERNTVK